MAVHVVYARDHVAGMSLLKTLLGFSRPGAGTAHQPYYCSHRDAGKMVITVFWDGGVWDSV